MDFCWTECTDDDCDENDDNSHKKYQEITHITVKKKARQNASLIGVDVESNNNIPGTTLVLVYDNKQFRRKSLFVPSTYLLNM